MHCRCLHFDDDVHHCMTFVPWHDHDVDQQPKYLDQMLYFHCGPNESEIQFETLLSVHTIHITVQQQSAPSKRGEREREKEEEWK
jgi:hypothetical protein